MNDNREFLRYISIEKNKNEIYDKLITSPFSIFFKRNKRDVFMYAASVGSYFGLKKPIKTKMNLNLFSDLPSDYRILSDVIALKSVNFNIDAIMDGKEVTKILEEYANGGIDRLYKMIMESKTGKGMGFEEEIFEILQKKVKNTN